MKTQSILLVAALTICYHPVSLHAGADEGGIPQKPVLKIAATQPPKTEEPKLAVKVPGQNGWIQSPYDGKILDASGFPSGSLVRDPSSRKVMRVP
jgi:hypothetical protein